MSNVGYDGFITVPGYGMISAKTGMCDTFQQYVRDNWRNRETGDPELDELRSLFIMTAGLAGETGEAIEHVKKYVRDEKFDEEKFCLEMGDALHYFTRIAHHFGLTLEEIMAANIKKLDERFKR